MKLRIFLTALIFDCLSTSCQTPQMSNKKVDGSVGRFEMARQLLESGQYVRAIEVLKSISSDGPHRESVGMMMGSALLGLGDAIGASSEYKKIIKLNKNNDDALLSLGYAYIVQKKFNNSMECFDAIIKRGLYPQMENVYINYGLAYMESGDCLKAQNYFYKALQMDPTLVAGHYNKGLCLMKEKKYAHAKASFQKALNFCQNCIDPALSLAKSKYLSGEKNEARREIEELIQRQKDLRDIARAKQVLIELTRD